MEGSSRPSPQRGRNPGAAAPTVRLVSASSTNATLDGASIASASGGRLSTPAKLYLCAVAAVAAAAAGPLLARLGSGTHGWTTFSVLAVCAAFAQLFVVRTVRDYSLHTAIVFLVVAALLLPPELVALMGVVQHLPVWLKGRFAWYIQTFNICNYTLDGLAAWGAVALVTRHLTALGADERLALAGLAACVTFVGLNHTLLAATLYLARGHRLRESGLFSWGNLSTELVLAALGIGLASLWRTNGWLVPFGVAPLLLIHRSLHVPRLEEQARIDPKTGLFNARHFANALQDELSRAGRFERPVSVIMADLDLLREINNAYGHLAGDAVLAGVAKVFRAELRHYDIPARFGGEEFAILLPETPQDQALEIAERVRKAVAAYPFSLQTSSEPIRATISIGIATFPKDGVDASELVHQADLAVYRAKLQGRNRVLVASEELVLLRGSKGPGIIPLLQRADAGQVPLQEAPLAAPDMALQSPPSARPGGRRLLAVARQLLGPRNAAEAVAPGGLESPTGSLERANHLLRTRSTAAMESLCATVDARDALTAGHSRRVRRLALAIGGELGMSQAELDLLGHAALFHDIGKLTIPDAILLKPTRLDDEEWGLMQRHPDEGARIIDRLGFLEDAVPAIRHHHERFDGTGYPDQLAGEEIPLGARVIHVADALDSMLTTRIYRDARTASAALAELQQLAGRQFCPRCVAALERILPQDVVRGTGSPVELLIA
jgi:diguanylate cyclase (GGDEF)-like protein/putative nucleotidyltransferase with HDIG domain